MVRKSSPGAGASVRASVSSGVGRLPREDAEGGEPGFDDGGPVGGGEGRGAEAEGVAAVGIDVEFGGDAGAFEGGEVGESVFDAVDVVVFILEEEGGWGLGGDVGADVGVEGEGVVGEGEVAGVEGDREVGAGGGPVGGIDGGVEAVGEVDAGGGDEMAAGGEAEDADLMRIQIKLGGVEADEGDGALGVFKGLGRGGVGAGFWELRFAGDAVLDEDAGDAAGSEPVADLSAFEINGEDLVAAAGEDEDGGVRGVMGRRVDGVGGDGDGVDEDPGAAGDKVGGAGGLDGFGVLMRASVRGCGRPEIDLDVAGSRLPGLGDGGEGGEEEGEEEGEAHGWCPEM